MLKHTGASKKGDNVDSRLIREIASLGKLGEINGQQKEMPNIIGEKEDIKEPSSGSLPAR